MGTRVVFEIMPTDPDDKAPSCVLFANWSHPTENPEAFFASTVDNAQTREDVVSALLAARYFEAGGNHRAGDRMFRFVDFPYGDYEAVMRLNAAGEVERLDAPDPMDAPATEAVFRCVDCFGNTAFVRHTKARGWACTLSNGVPASMSYAGVPHGEETATVVALERAKTVRDALRIMKARAQQARSVELER